MQFTELAGDSAGTAGVIVGGSLPEVLLMVRRPPSSNNRPSNRDDSTSPRRTCPANGIPYPGALDPCSSGARPRRSAKTNTAAKRTRELTPIPSTVWTTGSNPIGSAATWPVPIVEPITTSFSAVGDRVLLAPWPASEAHRAARDRDVRVARDAGRALGRDATVAQLVPDASSPADAVVLDGPGSAQTAGRARADLIITVLPSNTENDDGSSLETFAIAAARLLVFGGILAVYTHIDASAGRLIDQSGAMVAAAQNADLLYLQHIVTLHTPIRNGRLQPPPRVVWPVRDDVDHCAQQFGSPAPHTRVHGNVLVFGQAHADAADLR
ncbi:hypothetical protein ACIA5G_33915 [Amycolatopsis sp. NPDC051758]|uniref:hypothetical protein n=1 Tax=Amycolatopsis sp. NPDC051758 TaxID=3363935 RepID=UPI0037B3CA63